jgi:hypothetical protein
MEDADWILVEFETSPRAAAKKASLGGGGGGRRWWETTASRLEQLMRSPTMWSEADVGQATQFADWAEQQGKTLFWNRSKVVSPASNSKVLLTLCQFQCLLHLHSDVLRRAPEHAVKRQFLRMLDFPAFYIDELTIEQAAGGGDLEFEFESEEKDKSFEYIWSAADENVAVKSSLFTEALSNLNLEFYEKPAPVPVLAKSIAGLDDRKVEIGGDSDDEHGEIKQRSVSVSPERKLSPEELKMNGHDLLVKEILEVFRLISRDVLGNDPQSNVHSILKAPLEEFLKDWIPALFSQLAENKGYRKKVIADIRVNALRSFQSFTSDYHRSLELFRKKNGIEDFSTHRLSLSSEQSSSSLIAMLCKIIAERGDSAIIDPKSFDEMDPSDVGTFINNKLKAAQQQLVVEAAKNFVSKQDSTGNKAQDLVAVLLENLLTNCLNQLVETLSDPSLWMMIFHRIPRLNFPPFPPKKEQPIPQKGDKSDEKDIALDLGIEIMMVISNLLDLAQPKGVAGFLAQIGRHVLRSYVEELGNGLWNELKTPIDSVRASFICKMIKCVLWDEEGSGDHVFISKLSMYEQLKKESARREVQDSVVTELAEHVHNQALEKVPKGWSWVGNSLSSVYATMWTLAHLFVEVTQSPWIMRFIILQYCLGPFARTSHTQRE